MRFFKKKYVSDKGCSSKNQGKVITFRNLISKQNFETNIILFDEYGNPLDTDKGQNLSCFLDREVIHYSVYHGQANITIRR